MGIVECGLAGPSAFVFCSTLNKKLVKVGHDMGIKESALSLVNRLVD